MEVCARHGEDGEDKQYSRTYEYASAIRVYPANLHLHSLTLLPEYFSPLWFYRINRLTENSRYEYPIPVMNTQYMHIVLKAYVLGRSRRSPGRGEHQPDAGGILAMPPTGIRYKLYKNIAAISTMRRIVTT